MTYANIRQVYEGAGWTVYYPYSEVSIYFNYTLCVHSLYSVSTSSKVGKPTAPSIREEFHVSVPYANMHTLKGNTTV
jgi:uncharacterized Fe-S cluster protein YjdI